MITVQTIIEHMQHLADPKLAYSWDNVGLLIGSRDKEVTRILVTLDITPNCVAYALQEKVDMIVSHHPLFIKPLYSITNPLHLQLIQHQIAIYCAHTNLDVVKNGVNYALAEKLGLINTQNLDTAIDVEYYHVAVYVLSSHLKELKQAVFDAGAGKIEQYEECGITYPVDGQYKPLEGSNPYLGTAMHLEHAEEIKFEFFVDSTKLNPVIAAMLKAHPYETPAYAIYALKQKSPNYSLGLIGELSEKCTLEQFSQQVKKKLNAPFLRVWSGRKGDMDAMIKKVAICGGSGGSLLGKVQGNADVFVSADFSYHQFLDSTIPIIDAGHFYTENPVLVKITNELSDLGITLLEFEQKAHEINKLQIR